MEDTMRTLMIVLMIFGACLSLIALAALMDAWDRDEDEPQEKEVNLDNQTLAEAKGELG